MKITVEYNIPDEENCKACDYSNWVSKGYNDCSIFDRTIAYPKLTPCWECLQARKKANE